MSRGECFGASPVKALQAAIGVATLPLFNARGVVAHPTFVLSRKLSPPKVQKEPQAIEFTVRAEQVEGGLWIAEPGWACRADGLPMDVSPLHTGSKRFESRSEAVEAAMDRGMRMVRGQKHRTSDTLEWAEKVESLREWMAEAVAKVRDKDETLPLRGCTGMDLFAGGHGGFSMGLASLGVKIELACEIDPEAMAIYRKNVRPAKVHGDICTLDCTEAKVDFVTVGLLCQAFSPAGNGLGFADPVLANAYKHAMRVLGEVDAKVVIVECARRFLTLDAGKHCDEFITAMNTAGYRVQARAMNAAGFGVPQDRERSILICTRIGVNVEPVVLAIFLFDLQIECGPVANHRVGYTGIDVPPQEKLIASTFFPHVVVELEMCPSGKSVNDDRVKFFHAWIVQTSCPSSKRVCARSPVVAALHMGLRIPASGRNF